MGACLSSDKKSVDMTTRESAVSYEADRSEGGRLSPPGGGQTSPGPPRVPDPQPQQEAAPNVVSPHAIQLKISEGNNRSRTHMLEMLFTSQQRMAA